MNDYFDPNAVHDAQRLKELQALPLERKIMITQARIMEFVQAMGGVENVVVSYSGGKDSTVLLHICKQLYPDIKCVYSDTGLEYPEVRAMAKANGADIVRPKMRFDEVITKYGYPLISKEVSEAIYYARRIRNAPKESDEADAHGDGRLNCDLKPYGVEGGRLSEDEVTSTERDLTHTSVGGDRVPKDDEGRIRDERTCGIGGAEPDRGMHGGT